MSIGPIDPAFAWGIVIPWHGGGRGLATSTTPTRIELMKQFGVYFDEDWRKGWKKAYRRGYRAVRVKIAPAFGGDR